MTISYPIFIKKENGKELRQKRFFWKQKLMKEEENLKTDKVLIISFSLYFFQKITKILDRLLSHFPNKFFIYQSQLDV